MGGPATDGRGRPPAGFRVARELPVGRHPLLAAFPGLDTLESAARLEPNARARTELFDGTCVEVVAEDIWMYIAPWDTPKNRKRHGAKSVVAHGSDCVVIGQSHLAESPELTLFLDIFHELCHVRQRHAGRELWDQRWSYARRPTEVEAYRFVVEEGRRLGVSDAEFREYLEVEWISKAEHRDLLEACGVPPA
ncbi:MAG TPA: hypothetical protein VFF67_09080 [Thermoplasmata archaeon]|nr:hypothetical protein [Thermoplasmata archaeon]